MFRNQILIKEVVEPVVRAVCNEAHQLIYFFLGCFITYYVLKLFSPSKMKCHVIKEFNGINKL